MCSTASSVTTEVLVIRDTAAHQKLPVSTHSEGQVAGNKPTCACGPAWHAKHPISAVGSSVRVSVMASCMMLTSQQLPSSVPAERQLRPYQLVQLFERLPHPASTCMHPYTLATQMTGTTKHAVPVCARCMKTRESWRSVCALDFWLQHYQAARYAGSLREHFPQAQTVLNSRCRLVGGQQQC